MNEVPREDATALEEVRQLAKLAAPFAIATGGQALMGLVDTAVVGRVNAATLAAVSVGNSLYFTLSIVGVGLLMGLDPLISQAIGAGRPARARSLLWQGVWLSLLVASVLAIPVALSPHLLGLFSIRGEVATEATAYVLWRLPGLVPLLFACAQRSYLQSLGRAAVLVWIMVAANVFNLLADLPLVFGGASLPGWMHLHAIPAMGASGAALATTVCTLFEVVLLAWAVHRTPRGASPIVRAPHRSELREASRVGFPIGLHLLAETGIFLLAGLFAGKLGAESLAAHQVALSLASVSFTVALGVGNAGSVRVGWAVGAGRRRAVRRAGLLAFVSGASFMALSAVVFVGMPDLLVRLFTDDPGVVAKALPLIAICALFQISDGVQGVGAGVLRGMGDTRAIFVANLVGHYGLGLPLAVWLAFGMHLGVEGIWWGLLAGLSAVALGLFGRFWWRSGRPVAALAA